MVSDRLGNICHPLIYKHPKTGQPTLCFHQGMTSGFIKDYKRKQEDSGAPLNVLKDEVFYCFSF